GVDRQYPSCPTGRSYVPKPESPREKIALTLFSGHLVTHNPLRFCKAEISLTLVPTIRSDFRFVKPRSGETSETGVPSRLRLWRLVNSRNGDISLTFVDISSRRLKAFKSFTGDISNTDVAERSRS